MVLRRVLHALPSRQQDAPLAGRLRGRQVAHLAGGEARAGGQEVGPVLGLAQAQEIERVGLAHHERFGLAPERAPEDPVGPMGRVVAGVEQRPVVGRPFQPVAHAVDGVGQQPAGAEVLDPDGVPLRARGVVGEGEQPAVRAHLAKAHVRVGAAASEHVLVEQDFLRRRQAAPLAAEDGVLLALDRPGVVVEPVHPLRHREIGLLDPGDDLPEQPVLQLLVSAGHARRVGVLGPEVRQHLGPGPRIVPQPGVGVRPLDPGHGVHMGADGGDRWCGRGGRSGLLRRQSKRKERPESQGERGDARGCGCEHV